MWLPTTWHTVGSVVGQRSVKAALVAPAHRHWWRRRGDGGGERRNLRFLPSAVWFSTRCWTGKAWLWSHHEEPFSPWDIKKPQVNEDVWAWLAKKKKTVRNTWTERLMLISATCRNCIELQYLQVKFRLNVKQGTHKHKHTHTPCVHKWSEHARTHEFQQQSSTDHMRVLHASKDCAQECESG